jgi:hypothetical protein
VGCIDIYEHLGGDADGKVAVYLKVTVAKSLLDDSADPFASLFASGQNELTGVAGTVSKIDTELETGLAVQLSLTKESIASFVQSKEAEGSSLWRMLFPTIDNEKIVFSLSNPPGSGAYDNQMGLAMLSSYKYRLTVSRSICQSISKVVLSTEDLDYKAQFFALPDMFLIEVPLTYLVKPSKKTELIIYR